MGFDNTVFVNFDEARRLAKEYEKILKLEDKDHENMISCVMIKLKKSVDLVEIQNKIRSEFKGEGVYPLLSQSMMNEVSTSTQDMIKYVYIDVYKRQDEDSHIYLPLKIAQELDGVSNVVSRVEVSALTTPDNDLARKAARNPKSLTIKEWEVWYCTCLLYTSFPYN